MYPRILHLFGSFYINSFGLCLAISLVFFIWLISKDTNLKKILNSDQIVNLTIYTVIAGVISGRLLYFVTEFKHYRNFWELMNLTTGGGSVLGSMIGAIAFLIIFCKIKNLPMLSLLDAAGIYAPIIHSISRIGCFLAGCCHGCETLSPFAIMYTNPDTVAPLYVYIHPTQIYSALIFFLIFLFMYFTFVKKSTARNNITLLNNETLIDKPGIAFGVYLILSSLERISVDFIRGDRTFLFNKFKIFQILSFHQVVALSIFVSAIAYLFVILLKRNTIKA